MKKLSRIKAKSLRRFARFWPSAAGSERWLLRPPARSRGSLGDEAMMMAALQAARDRSLDSVGLFEWSAGMDWAGTDAMLSPESASGRGFNGWAQRRRMMQRHTRYLVLGADMLDGGHSPGYSLSALDSLISAARQGLEVRIIGSSFKDDLDPSIVENLHLIGERGEICVRDPSSFLRLQALGVPGIRQVADSAFCVRESSVPDSFRAFQQSADGDGCLVGLNLGAHALKRFGDQGAILGIMAEAVEDFLSGASGHRIVMIPHDYRGRHNGSSDEDLLRKVWEKLSPQARRRCFLPEVRLGFAEVRGIASCLDTCFSCRMHLAIACMSCKTPVGTVHYQGKFEGLYSLFDLDPVGIRETEDLSVDRIRQELDGLVERMETQRESIDRHLPSVLASASENFDFGAR